MIKYTKYRRPEIPDPDYEDPKEVFAFFGLAAYSAQLIEQGLSNLFVGLHVVYKKKPTWNDVRLMFENADKKTLGRLLKDVRKLVPFKSELEEELQKVLKKRNYLAHHFFVEHSEDFLHEKGRRQMIDELREIIAIFQVADPQIDELWHSLWEKYGFTEERIEQELTNLKAAFEECLER